MLRPAVFSVLLFVVGASGLLFSGCASLRYQDGYGTQFQIGPNRWICYYEGNVDMTEAVVLDYAINHCAEVTLGLGYKYYRILGVQRGGSTNTRYVPGWENTVVTPDPSGAPMISTYAVAGYSVTNSKDSYSVTIEVFNEPEEGTLNAQEVWGAFTAQQAGR